MELFKTVIEPNGTKSTYEVVRGAEFYGRMKGVGHVVIRNGSVEYNGPKKDCVELFLKWTSNKEAV